MPDPVAVALARHVEGFHYDLSSEDAVQRGVAVALQASRVAFRREVPVAGGRLDFLTDGGLAIEVKLHGSTPNLLRQLHRYAQLDEVQSILVVTSRHRLAQIPTELDGKPVTTALIGTFL